MSHDEIMAEAERIKALGEASESMAPSEPGTLATFASAAMTLASVFRPILRMASWGGPMNSKLQLRQISANWGFSLRNP